MKNQECEDVCDESAGRERLQGTLVGSKKDRQLQSVMWLRVGRPRSVEGGELVRSTDDV